MSEPMSEPMGGEVPLPLGDDWPIPPAPDQCPDGGACHHACGSSCFRVGSCGPLSGVYPNDEWPVAVRAAMEVPPT